MKKHFNSFTQQLKKVFVNASAWPQVQEHTVVLTRPEADYVEEQTHQLDQGAEDSCTSVTSRQLRFVDKVAGCFIITARLEVQDHLPVATATWRD